MENALTNIEPFSVTFTEFTGFNVLTVDLNLKKATLHSFFFVSSTLHYIATYGKLSLHIVRD